MPRCQMSVPASVAIRRYFARLSTARIVAPWIRAGRLRGHAPAQAPLAHEQPFDAPADEPGLDAPARRFYLRQFRHPCRPGFRTAS